MYVNNVIRTKVKAMMECTKCLNLRNLVLMAFVMGLVIQNGNCCDCGHSTSSKRLIEDGDEFVQRGGTQFVLNGKPIYLNGFNSYWLMYMASDPSTSSKVTSTLQEASKHGLNIARTWAFSDGGYRSLQVSPGTYDENVFKVYIYIHYCMNLNYNGIDQVRYL